MLYRRFASHYDQDHGSNLLLRISSTVENQQAQYSILQASVVVQISVSLIDFILAYASHFTCGGEKLVRVASPFIRYQVSSRAELWKPHAAVAIAPVRCEEYRSIISRKCKIMDSYCRMKRNFSTKVKSIVGPHWRTSEPPPKTYIPV